MLLPNDTPDFDVLKTLQEKYVLRDDWRDIRKFLNNYPLLPSVLVEAHSKLMEYFPNNPQVFLSLGIAPEDLRVDHLIASIASGLGVKDAHNALDAFDEDWWLDWLAKTKGKLSITLE